MGKSFLVDGGQNPLEPARKNCKIFYGPKISNFTEIYSYLTKKNIAFKVKNSNNLYNKLNARHEHLIRIKQDYEHDL